MQGLPPSGLAVVGFPIRIGGVTSPQADPFQGNLLGCLTVQEIKGHSQGTSLIRHVFPLAVQWKIGVHHHPLAGEQQVRSAT